jgi:hypothetical protein
MVRYVRHIIVLILAVCYFVPKPELLFTMEFPAHIVHHFFHANVFHFTVNAIAIWSVLDEKTRPEKWMLPVAFVIGSLSYCFALRPVIGFSNILFAMAGLRTPSFKNPWWKSSSAMVFFGSMIAMLFLPMVSATTHLVAYVYGIGIAASIRFYKKLDNDTRRAAGSK